MQSISVFLDIIKITVICGEKMLMSAELRGSVS